VQAGTLQWVDTCLSQKCPSHGGSLPTSNTRFSGPTGVCFPPKCHLDQFCHFCTAHLCSLPEADTHSPCYLPCVREIAASIQCVYAVWLKGIFIQEGPVILTAWNAPQGLIWHCILHPLLSEYAMPVLRRFAAQRSWPVWKKFGICHVRCQIVGPVDSDWLTTVANPRKQVYHVSVYLKGTMSVQEDITTLGIMVGSWCRFQCQQFSLTYNFVAAFVLWLLMLYLM